MRHTEGWPRTRAEAERHGYIFGPAWNPKHCAGDTAADCQCCRAPGYGPAGLYCKQHAKIMEQDNG